MKNLLKGTRVYLAGNMETSKDATTWRTYATQYLKYMGIHVFSPLEKTFIDQASETDDDRHRLKKLRAAGEYETVAEYMRGVIQKDLRLIDLSDFVIIHLDTTTPTYGTMHELVVSVQQKKPVFLCVNDKTSCPLWLLGLVKPEHIYDDLSVVLNKIADIDSGSHKVDGRYWRLLATEYR